MTFHFRRELPSSIGLSPGSLSLAHSSSLPTQSGCSPHLIDRVDSSLASNSIRSPMPSTGSEKSSRLADVPVIGGSSQSALPCASPFHPEKMSSTSIPSLAGGHPSPSLPPFPSMPLLSSLLGLDLKMVRLVKMVPGWAGVEGPYR